MQPGDPHDSIPDDLIIEALEAARKRVSVAEEERAGLDSAIAVAREEQRLLEKLLSLRQEGLTRPDPIPAPIRPTEDSSSLKMGRSALQVAVEELEAAGRPMHISELMRLLQDRNVQIPGSGTQANLITHLRRDARVVRPSRGVYALATLGLQNMPVPRRRRRRRNHMRSTKNQERIKT
jgi:hypothetical protein